MSTGELMVQGKCLEAVEKELYLKFLSLLDGGDWYGCSKIVELLEGLSLI